MWHQLLQYHLVQVTARPLVMAKKAHSTSLPTCCTMASVEHNAVAKDETKALETKLEVDMSL